MIENQKYANPLTVQNKIKQLQKLYQLDYEKNPQDLTQRIIGRLSGRKDELSV